jgi:organic radical activating enzyme
MKRLIKNFVERRLPKNVSKEILAGYRLFYFRFRKQLEHIEIGIAEHCNLNCTGCDHFSPIAAEEYPDIHSFERDMERLAFLTHAKIKEITIIGGEPLLNKDAADFFYAVRKWFPCVPREFIPFTYPKKGTRIVLYTNGILLPRQTDAFWKSCKDNSVVIKITKYPIKIDMETIEKKCQEYGIILTAPPQIKEKDRDAGMYQLIVSPDGKGNVKANWKYCIHNYWPQLRNGKIYPCTTYACMYHFFRFFGIDDPVCDNDTIDIYKAKNLREIMHFLAKPIPGCKYCDIGAYTYGHKWGISKKDIGEWT